MVAVLPGGIDVGAGEAAPAAPIGAAGEAVPAAHIGAAGEAAPAAPIGAAGEAAPAAPIGAAGFSPLLQAAGEEAAGKAAPAAHIGAAGFSPLLQAAREGRALLLSPQPPGSRLNKKAATWCNEYVLAHAREIWTGDISEGGMLHALLRSVTLCGRN